MKQQIFIVFLLVICFCLFNGAVQAATLRLITDGDNLKIGDTFQAQVMLDTQNAQTDGVELYYLRFSSNLLEAQDSNDSQSGVQISPGVLYPNTLSNNVSNTAGTIDFSQVTSGGQFYNGGGVLAVISFKIKDAGVANLTFDFREGATTDCNVVSAGADVLTSVENLTLALADENGVVPEVSQTSSNKESQVSQDSGQESQSQQQNEGVGSFDFGQVIDMMYNQSLLFVLVAGFIILLILWMILRIRRKKGLS